MCSLVHKLFKSRNSNQIIYSPTPSTTTPVLPTTTPVLPADDEEFSLEIREASPAHLLTTIKSFSMLSQHGIRKLESMEFEAGDYKWKLTIYPDGRQDNENNIFSLFWSIPDPNGLVFSLPDDEDNHISVQLSMVGTTSLPAGWEVNASFNILLYNHISDNYLCFRGKTRRFHALNSEWGFSKLMTKKYLRKPSHGFLVNDTCVFGAEVFVIKKQPLIDNVSLLTSTNPYEHDWEISDLSKKENVWTSQEFFAGGYKWAINLYPNGSSRARGQFVSAFLECKSVAPHKKVHATCRFTLKNKPPSPNQGSHSSTVRQWFTSSGESWGFDEFIAISDMRDPSKGFVVDDCCAFKIVLVVQAVRESLSSE